MQRQAHRFGCTTDTGGGTGIVPVPKAVIAKGLENNCCQQLPSFLSHHYREW